MKYSKIMGSLLLGALMLGNAQAQVKVGVVSSATGPVAMVGIPQKNTVSLLPGKAGDYTIEYIALDDGSDPTASVVAVRKLISEQNVDAIIGPSGSPNAMGVIQFVAEAGVPLLAPVGTAAVVQPMTEEREVIPLLIKYLTPEDWARADAGFAANRDPMGGTRSAGGQEDFARIFSKLVAAAPAPIGLGAGPYKDD